MIANKIELLDLINGGFGKKSKLYEILSKIHHDCSEDIINSKAKMWAQRIGRNKFRKIFENIKAQSIIEANDNTEFEKVSLFEHNDSTECSSSAENLQKSKIFEHLSNFAIERNKLFNLDQTLKKNWTSEIYVSQTGIRCPIFVSSFKIFAMCKSKECRLTF